MKPLKIAFLWHQHQPYYKKDDEFILPWVRMHGVKDYFDIPALLKEFPKIKQTFNLVPSLLKQIEEYLSGTKDYVQKLAMIPASELTSENKFAILDQFFVCNLDNMILKYPRYRELYEQRNHVIDRIDEMDNSYWLDLQCWYNLCWIGEISKQDAKIAELFEKQRNYTEEDKKYILEYHAHILARIADIYTELQSAEQIELSITPFFHPILPLLCHTDIAKISQPDLKYNENLFSDPKDADNQIKKAQEYFRTHFNHDSKGMWPSEGSVSEEALRIMISNGVRWAATDEGILQRSKEEYVDTDKYFPHRFENNKNEITLFFRDHHLSDKIGFNYSNWNHIDAVNDFMLELYSIKNDLIEKLGEDSLNDAIVPIILDGENCWEFYPDNGVHFLRELYRRLSETDDFRTVTFTEYLNEDHDITKLNKVFPGSWINSNFDIWIGQNEHQKAWKLLGETRQYLEAKRTHIDDSTYQEALEYIYIAEGSDWFWWYFDNHQAPNKLDFDVLFRWNLRKVYDILGESVPKELYQAIGNKEREPNLIYPKNNIDPEGIEGWGIYKTEPEFSTMHRVSKGIDKIYFALIDDSLQIKFKSDKQVESVKLIAPEKEIEGIIKYENEYHVVSFPVTVSQSNKFKVQIKTVKETLIIPEDGFIRF